MNKLLLLGLIGGGVYWLLRQSSPHREMGYLESDDSGRGMDESLHTNTLDQDEEQRLLDEALAESFPASDPPAVSPHRETPGL